MIIFEGRIFGAAAKHLENRSRRFVAKLFFFAMLFWCPFVFYFATICNIMWFLGIYLISTITLPLLAFIPFNKNDVKKTLPLRIIVDDDIIISENQVGSEEKSISDIKEIKDCGDFYDVVFGFGNISHNFICQKCLTSELDLIKFEELFKDKIIR